MSDQNPHDLLYTVNRRWDCLAAIVEQPQEKRELVETLSTPRSTLDTIVRELEQADLVRYHNGVWQPTITGETIAEQYADCLESVDSIHAAGQLLSPLETNPAVPTAVLDGAESYPAEEPVPDAVLTNFLERIAAATQIRGVAPRALSGYTDRLYKTAESNETTLELLIGESVFSQLTTIEPETIVERLNNDFFSVYCGPVDTEFGFWVGDSPQHVGLIIYADRGVHGVIINRSPAAVEWATEKYESLQESATQITPADVRQESETLQ